MKKLIENINNINVSKWLLVVPFPYKKKDAVWWIDHCNKIWKNNKKDKYEFSIELKEEKNIIGGITLSDVNKFQGTATTGYWLGEKYWRNGYGTEALGALLKFAFNKLKLRRLNVSVFSGNPSSGKLLEKFGAKKEGLKRKAVRSKANKFIYDEIIYGLLKSEWRKNKW
jgi:RimJ/RimL family protein N-acetyltransferase